MTLKKIFIVTSIVIVALLLYVVVMFIAAFGGFNFLLHIPKPEITYGEFPCVLTYEVDGEIKVIEDVIVCEFDGFEVASEAGKYRKWKTYLKSGNQDMTLLNLRPLNEKNEFGHTMLEFFFSYGNAEYYMGDTQRRSIPRIADYVEYKYRTEDGSIGGSAYSDEEAMEKYKIRMISWEAAPPIENKFK